MNMGILVWGFFFQSMYHLNAFLNAYVGHRHAAPQNNPSLKTKLWFSEEILSFNQAMIQILKLG